jgi:hypothetical protein
VPRRIPVWEGMLFSLQGSPAAWGDPRRPWADGRPRAGAGPRWKPYLENCIAAVGVLYRQDTKGTRWMPWRQKPMKDVDGCDKPR